MSALRNKVTEAIEAWRALSDPDRLNVYQAIRDYPYPGFAEALALLRAAAEPEAKAHLCDWHGHDGEGARCLRKPTMVVDGRSLCGEHGPIVERKDAWKR